MCKLLNNLLLNKLLSMRLVYINSLTLSKIYIAVRIYVRYLSIFQESQCRVLNEIHYFYILPLQCLLNSLCVIAVNYILKAKLNLSIKTSKDCPLLENRDTIKMLVMTIENYYKLKRSIMWLVLPSIFSKTKR
jgi:hypothetical protein